MCLFILHLWWHLFHIVLRLCLPAFGINTFEMLFLSEHKTRISEGGLFLCVRFAWFYLPVLDGKLYLLKRHIKMTVRHMTGVCWLQ